MGDIGSANATLRKDLDPPILSSVVVNPANVVTNDSSASFQCNEDGNYKVVMNAFDTGYSATSANTTNTVTLPNANIAV